MAQVVISGTLNSGKSTIMTPLLAELGWPIITESAREAKSPGEPMEIICKNIGLLDIKKQSALHPEGNYLLDRAYEDNDAYITFNNARKLYPDFETNYDLVLMFEVLPEKFFKNDNIRDESYETAVAMQPYFWKAYEKVGYNPIHIPFDTIDNRTNMVFEELRKRKII